MCLQQIAVWTDVISAHQHVERADSCDGYQSPEFGDRSNKVTLLELTTQGTCLYAQVMTLQTSSVLYKRPPVWICHTKSAMYCCQTPSTQSIPYCYIAWKVCPLCKQLLTAYVMYSQREALHLASMIQQQMSTCHHAFPYSKLRSHNTAQTVQSHTVASIVLYQCSTMTSSFDMQWSAHHSLSNASWQKGLQIPVPTQKCYGVRNQIVKT